MLRILGVGGWLLIGLASVAPAREEALTAYRLSDAQRQEFSTTDGMVSDFWHSAWTARNSLHLTSECNTHPQFDHWDATDDAELFVKAAASPAGLHFCVTAVDDSFATPPPEFGGVVWQHDQVELYLDAHSAAELVAAQDSAGMWVTSTGAWAASLQFRHVSARVGQAQPPTDFEYLTDHFCSGTIARPRIIPYGDGGTNAWGIGAEVIVVDSRTRVLELLFPWEELLRERCASGVNATVPELLPAGKRFAFTVGYNDRDVDGDTVSALRWKNVDPIIAYGNRSESTGEFTPPSDGKLNSWGDIEITTDSSISRTEDSFTVPPPRSMPLCRGGATKPVRPRSHDE